MNIIRRMQRSLHNRISWNKKLGKHFWWLYRFCPIDQRKIVIQSFYGRGYSDNPKYIVERLLEDNKYKIYWIVNSAEDAKTLPCGVQYCIKNSKESIYHCSTASVWIDNCRKEYFLKKRKQLYIQTWHGGGMMKLCEAAVEEKLPKSYAKIAKKDSKAIDLLLTDGKEPTKFYQKYFWYEGHILEVGFPRNDILKNKDNTLRDKICEKYGLDKNKRYIIYAPTFRNEDTVEPYSIDFSRLIRTCEQKFQKEYVCLVRLHPNIANESLNISYNDKIINVTFIPDAQELLVISDVLISDYSSILYDFSLKKGIAIRFATDLKDYISERGFCYDFNVYPYPVAENNDQLEQLINLFDYEEYISRLETFNTMYGQIQLESSQIIAGLIDNYMTNNLSKKKMFDQYSDLIK